MPPNTVKVDRSTKWGNPFVKHSDARPFERSLAVTLFSDLLREAGAWWPTPMPWPKGKMPAKPATTVDDVRRELRGKHLACWCPPGTPCHADVLLRIANEKTES